MQRKPTDRGASAISILVGVIIVITTMIGSEGCFGPSWSTKHEPVSPPPSAITVVRGAGVVESRHPPLAVLVVRVARSDLDLDSAQEPEVDDLLRKTNDAVRPIDEARILFLQTLARAVAEDQYSPTAATFASQRLVLATERALPAIESALIDLHAALSPRQRSLLVQQLMQGRIRAWAPTWRFSLTTSNQHHWIEGFVANDLDHEQIRKAMREDAIITVRAWCSQTSQRVVESLPTLNAEQRRALSLELELDPDD